ncbi:hypothetical protein PG995_002267 [Apiospora arundinis]
MISTIVYNTHQLLGFLLAAACWCYLSFHITRFAIHDGTLRRIIGILGIGVLETFPRMQPHSGVAGIHGARAVYFKGFGYQNKSEPCTTSAVVLGKTVG